MNVSLNQIVKDIRNMVEKMEVVSTVIGKITPHKCV